MRRAVAGCAVVALFLPSVAGGEPLKGEVILVEKDDKISPAVGVEVRVKEASTAIIYRCAIASVHSARTLPPSANINVSTRAARSAPTIMKPIR